LVSGGLAVRTSSAPACTITEIRGEIDLSTVEELHAHLLALPKGNVIIDLSGVRFLAAGGIRALMQLQEQRKQVGDRVVLAAARKPIDRVLQAAGRCSALEITCDIEAAVELVNEFAQRQASNIDGMEGGEMPDRMGAGMEQPRTWHSRDSDYRWSIVADRKLGRLTVNNDAGPDPDQARAFAGALLVAAEWLKARDAAPLSFSSVR
jgi:anti-anti-sigma factor